MTPPADHPDTDQPPGPSEQPRAAYRTIARVRSDFPSKFGVPRQAGLVPELLARVVFEPEFRSFDAVRGLDGFSHLWLVWEFSLSVSGRRDWSPTVRPPRLGGQERLGVFATRSPFRPNPIGLSSVRLLAVETDGELAPTLLVSGADLVDGTPVLDVKPYIPLDSHPEATSGFVAENPEPNREVVLPDHLAARVSPDSLEPLLGVLAHDPRPRHLHDPDRVYGLPFAGLDVRFSIDEHTVTVHDITPLGQAPNHPDALAQDRSDRWPGYR